MAFFTHSLSTSADPSARLVAWFVAACVLLFSQLSWAQSTALEQAEVRRADDGLYWSSSVALQLTTPVETALSKGIAVVFVTQIRLEKHRWYWYDKLMHQTQRHARLSFQPLTRKWRVHFSDTGNTGSGLAQQYDTLNAALAAIRKIPRLKLADASDLDNGTRYEASVQFKLDTSQLPKPFELGAAGGSDWQISAEKVIRFAPDGKTDVWR